MKLRFDFFGFFLNVVKPEHLRGIPDRILESSQTSSCTSENGDSWSTGQHVPCCTGLVEELVQGSSGNWHYICVSSCTSENGDSWSTGEHVPCCTGLVEELVQDSSGNWHYICTSASTPPAPTPSTYPGLGLCYGYGPDCTEYSGGCIVKVSDDMQRVADCPATASVNRIRTYHPSYYGTPVDNFSGFDGYSLLPGLNPRDALEWQAGLEEDLRNVYKSDQVDGIIYLNEKFADQDIAYAKTFLETTTKIPGKPIVTSQTTRGDYRDYTTLLAQGFDGIIINVYPNGVFSHDMSLTAESGFWDFCYQLNKISQYYSSATGNGEKFYGVGETGIPANPFGTQLSKDYYELIQSFVAGTKNCQDFSYTALVDMHGGPSEWLGIYAFEATSEPQKGSDLENSFGITDAICGAS